MKVLIVDDNKDLTELLAEYMSFSGFETEAAQNGLEALDKLTSGSFETVITDGYMPAMDGFDLCRFIKSHYPLTFIIGMTDSLSLDKFKEAGADLFFYKPLDPSRLCSSIRKRIARG